MVKSRLKDAKFLILLFFTGCCIVSVSAQALNRKQINAYVKKIDKLKAQNKLKKYFYPNKTCGGALEGWYFNDELVFIRSSDGGYELEIRNFMYVKDKEILKIVTKSYEYNKRRNLILKNNETSYPTSYNRYDCGGQMIENLREEKIVEK